MPLAPELALFALAVLVLPRRTAPAAGLARSAGSRFVGLARRLRPPFARAGGRLASAAASFVQDGLALFAKRLFLASAALSLLGSLTLHQALQSSVRPSITSRCSASLLGMMVLASARELILLFVAFELMSIPLFLLTGFLKRDAVAPEAALKFFLVGTVSAAVIVYGMSFVYGVTGSTALRCIPAAHRRRPSAHAARHGAPARRARLQDRRVPVPHVGAGQLRGRHDAVRGLALGGAEGRRASSRSSASTSRASAARR